jgi:hypothetical protein
VTDQQDQEECSQIEQVDELRRRVEDRRQWIAGEGPPAHHVGIPER